MSGLHVHSSDRSSSGNLPAPQTAIDLSRPDSLAAALASDNLATPGRTFEMGRKLLDSSFGRSLEPLELLQFTHAITHPNIQSHIIRAMRDYIEGFRYRPITAIEQGTSHYGQPLGYTISAGTAQTVVNVATELACRKDIGANVLGRVLLNPAVLAKLAVVYEHLPFMSAAKTVPEQEKKIRELIEQYAKDDAVLRFAREHIEPLLQGEKTVNVHELLSSDPAMYARAAIAHRWACRQFNVNPSDTDAQAKAGNGKNPVREAMLGVIGLQPERFALRMMIADIRKSPIPCDSKVHVGESLFFQKSSDPFSLSFGASQLDCFERGIRNIEVAADMLPFDPAKRLPLEYSDQEIARARALAETLNQTFTVHSAIVGPLTLETFRTPLFEDASDNVQLMKDTVDFAAKLGARTVVVHISDRQNPQAINNYAEIALHAIGKKAADGSPLRVSFENYMSKLRPDKTKPFPTMREHFEPFKKIVLRILEQTHAHNGDLNEALAHVALLLDSAHFNLVTDFREDPVKAVYDLVQLSKELADEIGDHKIYGELLHKFGFDRERFRRLLVSELHLNQNIGPIAFTIPGTDFNPDIHNPVQSLGTIDNRAFHTLLLDAGFGSVEPNEESNIIVLAEQKLPLDAGGLMWIRDNAKVFPGFHFPPGLSPLSFYIQQGQRSLADFKEEHIAEYGEMQASLESDQGKLLPHYCYMAGRFGIPRLREHLEARATHAIVSAQVDPKTIDRIKGMPMAAIKIRRYEPGDLLIKKGTSYEEAKETGTANLYLILEGSAVVTAEPGESFEIPRGMPFGEIMFLTGTKRTADVHAGRDGLITIEISEDAFWDLYKDNPAFHERVRALMKRRISEG